MKNFTPQPETLTDSELADSSFIYLCQDPDCEYNPTICTVPFCDNCGGSNCFPIVEGREGYPPGLIPANSESGLELQRNMKMI